jgi:hypothetical protein
MVSLSGVRVIRRKRDLLLHLRLHQFHRPSDGTSGELGFMRPRSSFSLYTNSYKMSRVICLIRVKQIMFCFICRKYERHTSLLSWHDEPPVWPCKAVNLQCPKGAPKAQGLTANARAKRQSACHEAPARLSIRHAQRPSPCCSNESLFHQSTCGGESRRSCEPPQPWRAFRLLATAKPHRLSAEKRIVRDNREHEPSHPRSGICLQSRQSRPIGTF